MTSATTMTTALDPVRRDRLMSLAREASFEAGTRLFEEGRRADRFWIVRTGTIALDLRVPGRRPAVIETLGYGELIGWSWHFPPH
ncbi:cyclic nucleotide-binding domain-containing protein, partial [Streptomyces sp. SID685]